MDVILKHGFRVLKFKIYYSWSFLTKDKELTVAMAGPESQSELLPHRELATMSAINCLCADKTAPWKQRKRQWSTPQKRWPQRCSVLGTWPWPRELILTRPSSSGTTTATHPWQTSSLCCPQFLHWYPGSKMYKQVLDQQRGQLPSDSHRRTVLRIHEGYASDHNPAV